MVNAAAKSNTISNDRLDIFEMAVTLNPEELRNTGFIVDRWKLHFEFLYGVVDIEALASGLEPSKMPETQMHKIYKGNGAWKDSHLNIRATEYRHDHNKYDEFSERVKAARKICYFNYLAKNDPAIGEYFLDRRYNFMNAENGEDEALNEAAKVIEMYDRLVSELTIRVTERAEANKAKTV